MTLQAGKQDWWQPKELETGNAHLPDTEDTGYDPYRGVRIGEASHPGPFFPWDTPESSSLQGEDGNLHPRDTIVWFFVYTIHRVEFA